MKSSLHYRHTPVQHLPLPMFEAAGVTLLVKREDLNHDYISGNKWWKLKYNLEAAVSQRLETLLTFGGAYSNHIYATAAAARELGLKSIGIIRGEKKLPLNATLTFAAQCGMHLEWITREQYRDKNSENFIADLRKRFGEFYLLPEGGTNTLAVKGCAEFAQHELPSGYDYVALPVGTGGTLAGLVAGLGGEKKIIGVSVLRNGEFLSNDAKQLLENFSSPDYGNWQVLTSYHHGGYAKVTQPLLDFIAMIKVQYNLPLDHLYTGKLLWALAREAEKGTFSRGSTVLALHTGGLQGSKFKV